MKITPEEREALVLVVFEPDHDCTHNMVPLYREVERVVGRIKADAYAAGLAAADARDANLRTLADEWEAGDLGYPEKAAVFIRELRAVLDQPTNTGDAHG